MIPTPVSAQARRDGALRLADAGALDAALAWLPEEPDTRQLRAFLTLLAGQPETTLAVLGSDTGHEADDFTALLRDAALAAAGDAHTAPRVISRAAAMEPSLPVSRCLAVAAAHHDLGVAGQAALQAMLSGQGGLGREAVIAAAAGAARADFVEAFQLLDYAFNAGGLTENETVMGFRRLLGHHHRREAAIAVASLGVVLSRNRNSNREFWLEFAAAVVPRQRVPNWALTLACLAAMGIAAITFRPLALPLMGLAYVWQRWMPLPGLDRTTSRLVRDARADPLTSIYATDAIAFLAGSVLGTVLSMLLLPNRDTASEGAVAVAAVLGIAVGGPGLAWGRRRVVHLLRARAEARSGRRRQAIDGCECLAVDFFHGRSSRTTVERHLQLCPITAPAGRVMACAATGVSFVDLPERQITVRVEAFGQTLGTAPVPGQHL